MRCDSGPPTLKVLSTPRLPRTSVQSCSSRPPGPCIPAGGERTAENGAGSQCRRASDTRRHLRREGLGHGYPYYHRARCRGVYQAPPRGLNMRAYAFGRALEDERSRSPESVAPRLRAVPEGNFVVGAFEGGHMVGQAGFVRYEGRKERHKGTVWGVYVTAAARGQGWRRPC